MRCPLDHSEIKADSRPGGRWYALALVGRQYTPADDVGPEVTLELRNCACESTLAREVTTTDADRATAPESL